MKKIKKFLLFVLIIMGANVIEAYSTCIVTIVIARHRDCAGFGFCKITGTITVDTFRVGAPPGNQIKALAEMNRQGHLVLTINMLKDVSKDVYNKYFSSGTFLFEDDFPVPPDILKMLNYSGTFTVKAGKYPVKMNGDSIVLEL